MDIRDRIPDEVVRFIDDAITSVDQLEMLLLLKQHRDRSWCAMEVSAELRSNEAVADERLSAMQQMGLLEREADGRYRYAPSDAETDRIVSRLSSAYRDFRLRIIERIFKKPDGLAAFADAFRIRKERR